MSLTLNTLRTANEIRDAEWRNGKAITVPLSFSALELAGEFGELCNEIKKIERTRLGIAGGIECDYEALADELGDVVISIDLLAMRLGIDLGFAVRRKFNKTSDKHGFETRL